MPPRAYWRGHVRLALVTFPVRLHAAVTSANKISLNMLHEPTGRRIHYQTVAEDVGPVDRSEIVKGYEVGKGRYVTLEDEELDALKLETRHTIDLVQFVESHEVDAIYYDRPYFMTPDGQLAEEAFCVIRDALREARKVALGQVVLSGKERLVAIKPCGRGLLLETLRYAEELREAEEYFEEIGTDRGDPDQVEMARALIQSRTKPFDPERFTDRYQEGLKELIASKSKGKDLTEVPEDTGRGQGNVVNLMDALKASLGQGGKEENKDKPKAKAGTKAKAKAAPSKDAKDKDKPAPRKRKTG